MVIDNNTIPAIVDVVIKCFYNIVQSAEKSVKSHK